MVLAITAFTTATQFVEPALLPALERTPDALHYRQYWRLFTPLFVHSNGWRQIAFNFPAIAVTGYFAERVFGVRLWLILYFVPGFVAELIGYVWQSTGAGASVEGAGLLGALAISVLFRVPQARFGASLLLAGEKLPEARSDLMFGTANLYARPRPSAGGPVQLSVSRTKGDSRLSRRDAEPPKAGVDHRFGGIAGTSRQRPASPAELQRPSADGESPWANRKGPTAAS